MLGNKDVWLAYCNPWDVQRQANVEMASRGIEAVLSTYNT